MTDEAMSPLRRRMIEDMTIRKFAPRPNMTSAAGQGLRLRQTVAGSGELRGRAPLSASSGIARRRRADHQQDGLDLAVLLQGHAVASRDRRAHPRHPRAAQAAGGAERGGRGAAARCGTRAQIQGGAQRGLWRWPASQRGRLAQDLTPR